MPYDLEERTARFAENVLILVKKIHKDTINDVIVRQLVRSATSIGANYAEADGAESKRDFSHKISICKKESKETKHWLRMFMKVNPEYLRDCQTLSSEVSELILIFGAILRSSRVSSRM